MNDFPIIDAHAHLRNEPGATESLISTMDRCGIRKAVVVAGGTISAELLSIHFSRGGSLDVSIDNGAIKQACDTSGGRLLPFFFANPIHGNALYESQGHDFYGLKLAPIVHGIPFKDERIHSLVETTRKFGHPIYLHCLPHRGFQVADLVDLAERFPDVRFILGHGGVGHGDFHGISLIKKCENIFFEMSGTFTHATRVACRELGADRVLFGTEYPLQDPSVELQKVECLSLSGADREKIMGGNILELLGRPLLKRIAEA